MRKLIAGKFSLIFVLLLIFLCSVLVAGKSLKRITKPCKRIVLHHHAIFQQGNTTFPNTTSAWVTDSVPGFDFFFGRMYVFDDPVTKDENMNSPPAARARGFCLYDSKEITANTLFLVTLSFNSTEYTGSLTMLGTNEHRQKTRDLSIVGGTGDFFLARGITTLESEVIDSVKSYFRLRMDIKLYECY